MSCWEGNLGSYFYVGLKEGLKIGLHMQGGRLQALF